MMIILLILNNLDLQDIKKDGINSWKTLEPLDREIITNKFNKATAAYQNKFASYLQQSASARSV